MKKESMTRALFFFIIVTFLTFFGSPFAKGTAKAETFRLTIGAAHPPVVIWVQRLRDFFCVEVEKRVKEKTGHEIKWVQAFGGTLAKMGEELEAVEGGVLDVSLIGLPFEPSKLYLHCFSYFVPFGIADLEQMTEVGFKVYDEVPWLKQVFEQKFNQKCLAPFASSGNVVIGSFPWQKIEDLKGKKIAGAGPNLLWFHPLGAVPTQINYGEAYSAGKSGVIDGGLATPGTTMAFKLYEVSDYYVECGFGAVLASVLTMNLNKWQKLPEAVRKILSEVSREYSFDQARA
ncbi:MAG: TRAP transporter substrate-binding protein DctP, partial [Deltaproteobacteria bacterium]|nr:TRAP transporter substrate-binding protein DctP [Deltaproteobacteria bacterium]